MYIKRVLSLVLGSAFLLLLSNNFVLAQDDEDEEINNKCVGCHINVNQGIVKQYLDSPMGNPHDPENKVVCSDCHGEEHQTAEDYKKADLPTAETCGECHKQQLKEFRSGKHNLAWFGMKSQIAWHGQPGAIVRQGYRGCSGCHKIGQKGLLGIRQGVSGKIKYDGGEEESHYRYGNAQCDACHTRHSFKKSEAQDPRSCSNCHMGFDHPQWEMYVSAKHGIIWEIEGHKNVRGRAPTCQKCHMPQGNHAVVTPWGFLGLRVPTKHNVLALIEKAPSLENELRKLAALLPDGNYIDLDDDPDWTLDRASILQALGILDDKFQPTERYIEIVVQGEAARGPEPFNEIRLKMKGICNECHAKGYVNSHFEASDAVIKASDDKFADAIRAVQGLYKDGILQKPEGWEYAPDLLRYYEAKTNVEQELYLIMLEYRQRAFQGAFHASNDYMHWYGWAPLNSAVNVILEEAKHMREEHKAKH